MRTRVTDLRLGEAHGPGKARARNIQKRVKREARETRVDMSARRFGLTTRLVTISRREWEPKIPVVRILDWENRWLGEYLSPRTEEKLFDYALRA